MQFDAPHFDPRSGRRSSGAISPNPDSKPVTVSITMETRDPSKGISITNGCVWAQLTPMVMNTEYGPMNGFICGEKRAEGDKKFCLRHREVYLNKKRQDSPNKK